MDEIGNSGGGLPIVSHNNGEYVSERTGREIHLLPEVRSVLKDIVWSPGYDLVYHLTKTVLAIAAPTDYPIIAHRCLMELAVTNPDQDEQRIRPNVPLKNIFKIIKLEHDTKLGMVDKIMKVTLASPEDVILFDQDAAAVSAAATTFGINAIHTPNGLTHQVWRDSLLLWRDRVARLSAAGQRTSILTLLSEKHADVGRIKELPMPQQTPHPRPFHGIVPYVADQRAIEDLYESAMKRQEKFKADQLAAQRRREEKKAQKARKAQEKIALYTRLRAAREFESQQYRNHESHAPQKVDSARNTISYSNAALFTAVERLKHRLQQLSAKRLQQEPPDNSHVSILTPHLAHEKRAVKPQEYFMSSGTSGETSPQWNDDASSSAQGRLLRRKQRSQRRMLPGGTLNVTTSSSGTAGLSALALLPKRKSDIIDFTTADLSSTLMKDTTDYSHIARVNTSALLTPGDYFNSEDRQFRAAREAKLRRAMQERNLSSINKEEEVVDHNQEMMQYKAEDDDNDDRGNNNQRRTAQDIPQDGNDARHLAAASTISSLFSSISVSLTDLRTGSSSATARDRVSSASLSLPWCVSSASSSSSARSFHSTRHNLLHDSHNLLHDSHQFVHGPPLDSTYGVQVSNAHLPPHDYSMHLSLTMFAPVLVAGTASFVLLLLLSTAALTVTTRKMTLQVGSQ